MSVKEDEEGGLGSSRTGLTERWFYIKKRRKKSFLHAFLNIYILHDSSI